MNLVGLDFRVVKEACKYDSPDKDMAENSIAI